MRFVSQTQKQLKSQHQKNEQLHINEIASPSTSLHLPVDQEHKKHGSSKSFGAEQLTSVTNKSTLSCSKKQPMSLFLKMEKQWLSVLQKYRDKTSFSSNKSRRSR
mmetsp:Transcript_48567/g.56752  ORF Transcript_48567/g.56752 Transcript_48567/m.56752 type:complete len:105 (-) Transcript_48567:231-545(-)